MTLSRNSFNRVVSMAFLGVSLGIALSLPAHAEADCQAPVAPNLVRNHNFECDGVNKSTLIKPVTGWTISGANIGETSSIDPNLSGHAGYLAIGTVNKLGTVSQTLKTKVGQLYQLTFEFSSDGTPGNGFQAEWGSQVIFGAVGMLPRTGWAIEDNTVIFNFYVVATSTKTNLVFAGEMAKSGAFVGVDNVHVVPVSNP